MPDLIRHPPFFLGCREGRWTPDQVRGDGKRKRRGGVSPPRLPCLGPGASGGRLRSLGKRRAGLGDDGAERLAFVHRDIGQDLAVEVDSGELQAVHELAVGQALGADRGVDPLDPQRPERALLHLAVAIGILAGLLDGLTGDPDRVLAAAVIALRLLEDPLVAGLGGGPALDACHARVLLTSGRRAPRPSPAPYRRRRAPRYRDSDGYIWRCG